MEPTLPQTITLFRHFNHFLPKNAKILMLACFHIFAMEIRYIEICMGGMNFRPWIYFKLDCCNTDDVLVFIL